MMLRRLQVVLVKGCQDAPAIPGVDVLVIPCDDSPATPKGCYFGDLRQYYAEMLQRFKR